MTLTAAYRAEDAAYRIDFETGGAPAVGPMYVPEGAVVALPEPQRADFCSSAGTRARTAPACGTS